MKIVIVVTVVVAAVINNGFACSEHHRAGPFPHRDKKTSYWNLTGCHFNYDNGVSVCSSAHLPGKAPPLPIDDTIKTNWNDGYKCWHWECKDSAKIIHPTQGTCITPTQCDGIPGFTAPTSTYTKECNILRWLDDEWKDTYDSLQHTRRINSDGMAYYICKPGRCNTPQSKTCQDIEYGVWGGIGRDEETSDARGGGFCIKCPANQAPLFAGTITGEFDGRCGEGVPFSIPDMEECKDNTDNNSFRDCLIPPPEE